MPFSDINPNWENHVSHFSRPSGRGKLASLLDKYTTFTRFGNEFFRSEHLDSSSPARKATAQAILSYLISLQKYATRWPIFSCKSLSYVKSRPASSKGNHQRYRQISQLTPPCITVSPWLAERPMSIFDCVPVAYAWRMGSQR